MPAFARIALLLFGVIVGGYAAASDTYVVTVREPAANRVAPETAARAGHPGLYYVSGHVSPEIRVEVQVGYYTVEPDFQHCGARSYGWPKPVHLYHRVVHRPTSERYGILLSRSYDNADDPKARLCSWRMSDVVVRAYRDGYGDLMAVVRFNLADRAPHVTDPRPVPETISLACSRNAAPLSDWKPRCQYFPAGSAETHFILNDQHSDIKRTADGSYVVGKPIRVDFRFND